MFGKKSSAKTQGQRRSIRRQAFFSGKIVHCDGSHWFSCTIRDISELGAKIEIRHSDILQERFFLLGSRTQTVFEAELAWRKGNFAGVRFLREHDLVSSEDPRMLRLRFHSAELSRAAHRPTA